MTQFKFTILGNKMKCQEENVDKLVKEILDPEKTEENRKKRKGKNISSHATDHDISFVE